MNLCLFGGTFNPIHYGHIQMAQKSMREYGFDKFYFIPTGNSYLKDSVLSANHRYNMVRIAVDYLNSIEPDRYEVSDIEIKRQGPSYTYETLEEFKKLYPDAKLFFLLGEDSIKYIESWKNPDIIMSLSNLIVLKRYDGNDDLIKVVDSLNDKYNAHINVIDFDMKISSTLIRNEFYRYDRVRNMVPDKVREYIISNKIYL